MHACGVRGHDRLALSAHNANDVAYGCRMLEPPEAVTMKFEADEAADANGAGGPAQQRLNFARPSGVGLTETSGLGRHTFFRTRKLQRVTEAF